MGSIPEAAWVVIGGAFGAFLQYLIARSTNAATIAQQNRAADSAQVERMLASKDADLKAEREMRIAEQARADRYLAMLLEDERTMHRAAEALNQQTGGAP